MDNTIPSLDFGSIADYEAEVLAEIEAAAPADPLVALRSDYNAALEHQADVAERYKVSHGNLKANIQDIIDKLESDWRLS